jgi:hypothetical protein
MEISVVFAIKHDWANFFCRFSLFLPQICKIPSKSINQKRESETGRHNGLKWFSAETQYRKDDTDTDDDDDVNKIRVYTF